jgi:hypothetical protein
MPNCSITRSLSIAFSIVLISGACSDNGATPTDGALPDSHTSDASTDAGDSGVIGDAAGCPAKAIQWGPIGGNALYRDQSTLTDCSAFTLERIPMGGGQKKSCQTTVAADDAKLVAVLAVLAQSDVQQALTTGGGKLYGHDSRPVDGTVFQLTVDGQTVLVGDPCSSGSSSCTPIPTGLNDLRTKLGELEAAQRAKSSCSNLAP